MTKNAFLPLSILVLVLLVQASLGPETNVQTAPIAWPTQQRISSELADSNVKTQLNFGRVPLYFIANKGQRDERVSYYIQGRDRTLYFTPEGLTIVLDRLRNDGGGPSGNAFSGRDKKAAQGETAAVLNRRIPEEAVPHRSVLDRWVVKIDFVGANRVVLPVGEEKTEAQISYFKGQPADWQTGIPTYSKIRYRELWPGIDLVYSGTPNRLKYEFLVHPGADPAQIRLAYRGATSIGVNSEGRLEATTPAGALVDDLPTAFQDIDGQRIGIPVGYRLDRNVESAPADQVDRNGTSTPIDDNARKSSDRRFVCSFDIGRYDRTRTLVLDPAVFVYCGYIGGNSWDNGYGIAVDSQGNAYITGPTAGSEATFPETVGPDLSWNGTIDAFVAKVNAAGTALLYCGFIGGDQQDYSYGIDVDDSGCAYVTGNTISTQATFPVTVGPILTQNGGEPGSFPDAFVAKVSASGDSLVYCGYVGGKYEDKGYAIAVDGAGSAYITGFTTSDETTFPAVGGPDLSYNGGADIFVAKVNPAGTGFVYRGYIGGSGSEYGYGIAVDASGNAHVTGTAYSGDFPIAVGPDLTFDGYSDAFVAKINTAGTALVYCGYIGGSGSEEACGIAVDGSGCAYITGYTDSTEASFPVTVGPDLSFNGNSDAFVAKVNASGSSLDYCGYVGGAGIDYGYGIAADHDGNAYIAGETASAESTFPATRGPDLTYNGNRDAFVAKIRSGGSVFEYCGYIGGTDWEYGRAIAVDDAGDAYVTGMTKSSAAMGFPASGGPDLSQNGFEDAFVARIFDFDENTSKHAEGDFDADGTNEVAVDFGSLGIWLWNGATWAQLSPADPEGLLGADVDGDNDDEIVADLGGNGLWIWNSGVWVGIGGVNPEGLAAGDVDGDGAAELVVDFGVPGLWLWNAGAWSQLSGINSEYAMIADVDGAGGAEVIADFGPIGLWLWNAGAWSQLSSLDANHVRTGNTDGLGGAEVVGDFGAKGLWLWAAGAWSQLSGVFPDFMVAADIDGNGDDEIIGDFGLTGLWFWDGGVWTQLSGLNSDFMTRANVDGGSRVEVAVDFGPVGLWLWNGATWAQLSGVNPQYLIGADLDGDNQDEILVDFGNLGLWLWDSGAWTQLSGNNPE